ncbi:MAG: hypothetical protein AB7K71_31880 [Polyangiaceae bacterium]
MSFSSKGCALLAVFALFSAACVAAPQEPATPEAPPPAVATEPSQPEQPAEPLAESTEPAAPAAANSDDSSAGYQYEGKVWKTVPLEQCLPAYRKCVESIPPDARGNLGLSYEHHLAGIKLMEEGKLDATAAHKQCNGMMFMLQQGGKC